MALAALIVSIVSALIAAGGVVYGRHSARVADKSAEAAEKSADAAAVTARLDIDLRPSELTPRFRITCEPAGGQGGMRMKVAVTGPPEAPAAARRIPPWLLVSCRARSARRRGRPGTPMAGRGGSDAGSTPRRA